MEQGARPSVPLLRRRGVGLTLLAAGLLLAGAGAGAFYARRQAERHEALAEEALAEDDLPAACEHLRHALTFRLRSAEDHFRLAQALRRNGEFDEAARHRDAAARLGWDAAAVRRESMLARLQQEQVREAPSRELLALAQSARPPDKDVLEALYRGDLECRNWDRAGQWLYLYLESYPDDWEPRLWQAELLERFKKYDQARADYLRVLERRPDNPRALLGLGRLALAGRADYDEAEAYLGRYLARRPGDPEAALGLARCAFGRGDLATARKGARELFSAHPEQAGAALLLGEVEAEEGHDEEAVRWLRQAEDGGADRQAVCYQLAQVLRRLGHTEDAQDYAARYTELREKSAAAVRAARAAEREPENAQLQYEAGRLTLATGAEEYLAAQWFLRALKVDPNHRPSHAALADYFAHRPGRAAAARAEQHRAAAAGLAPGEPDY